MNRFGILGGTFDPVHTGHLMLAYEARFQLALDKVFFIPSARPPHKNGIARCGPEDRYRMVELAVAPHEGFEPLRIEIERPGSSYAVDTLRALHCIVDPGDELVFILGWDAFVLLDTWREAKQVVELCRFAVFRRPGTPDSAWPAVCPPGRVSFLDAPQLAISSTEIRSRIANGRPYRYMVPDPVFRYLSDNRLYLTDSPLNTG